MVLLPRVVALLPRVVALLPCVVVAYLCIVYIGIHNIVLNTTCTLPPLRGFEYYATWFNPLGEKRAGLRERGRCRK